MQKSDIYIKTSTVENGGSTNPTGKEPPSHMGGSAPIAKFTDDLDKPKQVQFIDDLGDTKPEDKKQSKPTQGGAFDDLPETSQSKP